MHLLKDTHPTKELQDFIKLLIETKSKEEEDKIIRQYLDDLKVLTSQKNLSNAKMIEYCIKAIYSEMLGHDASFTHIFAIKMIESKSIFVKKVGYLASSLMLDSESDLKILLVATLQRDLGSRNELEVIASLNALNKLINASFAPVFAQGVSALFEHKNPIIRKKSLIAMQKIEQLSPNTIPLYYEKIKKALLSTEPSVINASLSVIYDDCLKNKEPFVSIVKPLCDILKQITQKKLCYYDYQKIPEPYMQIKILKILGIVAKNDKKLSSEIYDVIESALSRSDNLSTDVSYAIVFECVLTICSIYYDKNLVTLASAAIAKFLNPALNNSNMIYMGIKALRHLSEVEPGCVQDHQIFVLSCLESVDDTIKRITLDLLCKNTKSSNLETITSKLLKSLVSTNDQSFKADLTRQIFDLAIRYSTDFKWFVEKLVLLLKNSSDNFKEDMISSTIKIFEENFRDDEETGVLLVRSFMEFFKEVSLPDVLVKLISWIIGNVSLRINSSETGLNHSFEALKALYNVKLVSEETRIWILDSMFNLSRMPHFDSLEEMADLIKPHQHSRVNETRLKISEILSQRGSKPSFEYLPVNFDAEMPFLLDFMNSKKGKFYDPTISERVSGSRVNNAHKNQMALKITNEEQLFRPKTNEKAIIDGTEDIIVKDSINAKWSLGGYQKDTKEPKTSNIAVSGDIFSNMETRRPKIPVSTNEKNQNESGLFAGLTLNKKEKAKGIAPDLFGISQAESDIFSYSKEKSEAPSTLRANESQYKNTTPQQAHDDFDDFIGFSSTDKPHAPSNPLPSNNHDDLDLLMGEYQSKTPNTLNQGNFKFKPYEISEEAYKQLWEDLEREKEGQTSTGENPQSFISGIGFALVSKMDDDYICAALYGLNSKVLLYLSVSGSNAEYIIKSNDQVAIDNLAHRIQ
jgi:hypothetical protein